MADNVYQTDPSGIAPVAAPTQVPGGASDSPFSFGGDPNQPGMLGMSRGFWRDIANLGANMTTAANARTAGGFLANGTGFMGPFGAAVGETLQQGQKNSTAQAALNQSAAVTQGQTLTNQKAALDLQLQRVRVPYVIDQMKSGGLSDNGTGLSGASTGTGTPAASVNVPAELSGAIKSLEAGSPTASKTGLNQLGYAGNYQMGTAALADAGLYQPAKGEDLSKNQWQGKITVPGFDPMGVQDFIANPKAQDAAFNIHMGNLSNRAHNLGLDSYVGQTIGGVNITPEAIAAMEHFAGPAGTLHYLQSGGTFNPKDANGMHVSDYANRVTAALGANYKSPPNWFMQTAGAAPAAQPDASGATTGATTGVDDTGTSVGSAPTGAYQVAQAGGAVPASSEGGAPASAGASQVKADVNAIVSGMQNGRTPAEGVQEAQATNVNPYAVSPNQTITPQAPPGYMTPQQAMQRSAYLRGLAQRQSLAGLTEMSTQTNQAALQLEQYAQQALLQQSNSAQQQVLQRTKPQDLPRPGSAVTMPGLNGAPNTIVQAPDKVEEKAPDGSIWTVIRNNIPDPNKPYVRPAGVPEWAPEGTLAAFPKELSKGQQKAADEFWGEAQVKQNNAAIGTLGWTQTMQSNFDALNKTGDAWSKTGPSAEMRLGMASHVNDVFRFLGLAEPFNVVKIENWEELEKQTKTAGMQLVNSFFGGSREAASIVQSAMGAVPSSRNSPLGSIGLMNVIREVAQYQVDKRHFISDTAQKNGGDYGLPADQFDPNGSKIKQYMTRATSQTAPIAVKSSTPEDFQKNEASRFLPGTMIRLPDGRTMAIPYPSQGQ